MAGGRRFGVAVVLVAVLGCSAVAYGQSGGPAQSPPSSGRPSVGDTDEGRRQLRELLGDHERRVRERRERRESKAGKAGRERSRRAHKGLSARAARELARASFGEALAPEVPDGSRWWGPTGSARS